MPTKFAGKADKRGRRRSNTQPQDRQSDKLELQYIPGESVTASESNACNSEPTKRRKLSSDAAPLMGIKSAEVNPNPVETDFAVALKMLATLPLSDEERADAVRRLPRRDE